MQDKKTISFEATSSLRDALRTEAFRKDISVSALIRQILEGHLQRKDAERKIKK